MAVLHHDCGVRSFSNAQCDSHALHAVHKQFGLEHRHDKLRLLHEGQAVWNEVGEDVGVEHDDDADDGAEGD